MPELSNTVKYLKDYAKPSVAVEKLDLIFELDPKATSVTAKMELKRLSSNVDLQLDGINLKLLSIKIDGKTLTEDRFQVSDESLIIHNVPEEFTLETKVRINPEANTALTGLYKSSGNFCTQCEAEGFRHITYYFDRPDVLTEFTTKIIADKSEYPILLSNGNLIESGELASNQHFAVWHDPFKKPCYLFALVAGNLEFIEDTFVTRSNRKVTLRIFVEKGNQSKATYAMTALKQAMRWDEEAFNREYDLDIFMIVAVSDFNMGAMENKGLNIFNSKYILASEDTATDEEYEFIAAVIAHEYCHNWSGNRITCRDWFQLSLKEGLTIFRDQEFTSDTTSRPVKRIKDVRNLRNFQFPEDAGPMSHPVQPDSYMEIDNFYTHTVYEKGAEVIRMMKAIIGDEAFYAGLEIYFSNYDGQAVTIEEFVSSMEKASHKDLKQFRLWYKQAGTPVIKVISNYDEVKSTLTVKTHQSIPATADSQTKQPMHIPMRISLYGKNGQKVKAQLLELTKESDEFVIPNVNSKPIVSLLNDFSAPVEIDYDYAPDELTFLLQHDQNTFSKWEAGQTLAKNLFLQFSENADIDAGYLNALRQCLRDTALDKSFVAELLTLPSEKYLMNLSKPIDVKDTHHRYKLFKKKLASALYDDFIWGYDVNKNALTQSKEDIGARKLKNLCLAYLAQLETEDSFNLANTQYQNATNMTDRLMALKILCASENPHLEGVLSDFYQRFKDSSLVLDKWFSAQAMADLPQAITEIKRLLQHPDFNLKNPNKVRALIGAFSMYNLGQFHREDGAGYQLLADIVIQLNHLNPQIAARLLEPLTHWKDFIEPIRNLMQTALKRIYMEGKLSPDVFEVVEKSLGEK